MAQATPYSFTERKRIRKNFGKRESVLNVPYLLTMQQDSYVAFLQKDVAPQKRKPEGLQAAFLAALLALAHVERRLGDVELDELHLDHAVVRHDRERGQEGRLQPFGLAPLRRHVLLQEGDVRVLLHRQQVGDVQDALALSEVLPDPLAFGKAIGGCLRHTHSVATTRTLALGTHLVGDWHSRGPLESATPRIPPPEGGESTRGGPSSTLALRLVAW